MKNHKVDTKTPRELAAEIRTLFTAYYNTEKSKISRRRKDLKALSRRAKIPNSTRSELETDAIVALVNRLS